MKTTLNINDTVMAELKREAVRQQRTLPEMVEMALRMLLRNQKKKPLPPLPSFSICTRDTDFHRFSFLEIVDPVRL